MERPKQFRIKKEIRDNMINYLKKEGREYLINLNETDLINMIILEWMDVRTHMREFSNDLLEFRNQFEKDVRKLEVEKLNREFTLKNEMMNINGISEKFTQKPNISFLELFPKYSI